ncbi:hypothetical protein ElyMa_004220300 [Elysia marginata]|uniref:Transmembrane protein 223 n=1 Tax=Elysia marginata TaxID=1093978 RepID=A0AAV4GPX6_9GAST|nr:hypothetical protein ElyMa_004220300 [Elysia marginata]
MLSIGKLTMQTRAFCISCIGHLHRQPLQLKAVKRPLIFLQPKHPTVHKPLVSTRCLRVKPGANQSMKPQHKRDKMPASCILVYESGLKNYISTLYMAVAFLGVTTGTVVVLRWQHLLKNITYLDGVYLTFVLSLSLLVLAIAYRFARTVIIRIYNDTDSGQFVAVRRTCLGRLRQVVYNPSEVKLKEGGKFTNLDTKQSVEVNIQGQDYYLSASGFSAPVYYNVHLGDNDVPKDFSKSFVSDPKF